MSQPIDAAAGKDLPADAAATEAQAGWKLVEDAPTPDIPHRRDRSGVPAQGVQHLPGRQGTDPDRAVVGGSENALPIGGDDHGAHTLVGANLVFQWGVAGGDQGGHR